MAHESEEGGVQSGIQSDDERMPRAAGTADRLAGSCGHRRGADLGKLIEATGAVSDYALSS